MKEYGGKGVALSDRAGLFTDLTKSFVKALGSPNYFDHDCTCGRNTHHATKSLFGVGRGGVVYDIKNTKHIVLYGRNLIESLQVKEAKDFIEALSKGAKCTYIDPRGSLTAVKATRFWQIPAGHGTMRSIWPSYTLCWNRGSTTVNSYPDGSSVWKN